jgi:hypothetical protein
MQKSISVLFSLFWILTLVAIPPTEAQTPMGGLCGKLSEDNCAIITESFTTMQAVTSVNLNGTMAMDISGFDESEMMGIDTIGINLAIDGVGGGNFSQMYALQGNPSALLETFKDPETLISFIESYSESLNSITMQVAMTMTFSEQIQPLMEMQGYGEIPVELRMSDGIMYVYSDLLAQQGNTTWQGLDFSRLGASLRQSFDESFTGEAFDAETLTVIEGIFNSDYVKLMSDPTFFNQYVIVTRLEDQTSADGQNLAVFKTSYNYAGMFSDPEMLAALESYAQMMEELDSTTSSEEMLDSVNQSLAMYENMTYETTQWIGVDDFYVYHSETLIEMRVDPAMLEGMEGNSLAESTDELVYHIEMSLDFSDFNAPIEIEIPEDVEITDVVESMENNADS